MMVRRGSLEETLQEAELLVNTGPQAQADFES